METPITLVSKPKSFVNDIDTILLLVNCTFEEDAPSSEISGIFAVVAKTSSFQFFAKYASLGTGSCFIYPNEPVIFKFARVKEKTPITIAVKDKQRDTIFNNNLNLFFIRPPFFIS